jgi:hypothetical protein
MIEWFPDALMSIPPWLIYMLWAAGGLFTLAIIVVALFFAAVGFALVSTFGDGTARRWVRVRVDMWWRVRVAFWALVTILFTVTWVGITVNAVYDILKNRGVL